MMELSEGSIKEFIRVQAEHGVLLEGNILNVIKTEDPEFIEYIRKAKIINKQEVKRRLDLTRELQAEQKANAQSLIDANKKSQEIELLKQELEVQNYKLQDDLDIMSKKKQFELLEQVIDFCRVLLTILVMCSTLIFLKALAANVAVDILATGLMSMFLALATGLLSMLAGATMGQKMGEKIVDSINKK